MTPTDKAEAVLAFLNDEANFAPLQPYQRLLAQTLQDALSRHAAPTHDSSGVQTPQALRRAYR